MFKFKSFLSLLFISVILIAYNNCGESFTIGNFAVDSFTEEQTSVDNQETQPPSPPVETIQKTLSEKYPGDNFPSSDTSIVFHENFENGWGKWTYPSKDTKYIFLENNSNQAHSGNRYLRSTVTHEQLGGSNPSSTKYISSIATYQFPKRQEQIYIRFYAYFKGLAPTPHHWFRVAGGDSTYASDGWANNIPPGDKGFWYFFDVNNITRKSMFYVYWHDQTPGNNSNYGNEFRPIVDNNKLSPDQWVCIELMTKVNDIGNNNGELAYWRNNELVRHYRKGNPIGQWSWEKFKDVGDCKASNCSDPAPFTGFNFRTSPEVKLKRFHLEAYYQSNTFNNALKELRNAGHNPSTTQTILYDDVVVATERIGCKQ